MLVFLFIGTQRERTDWHRVVVGMPGLKERILNTVKIGDRVLVLGSLSYKERIDANGARLTTAYISAGKKNS